MTLIADETALKIGQRLEWVWGQYNEEWQIGARVGYNAVVSIEVGQLPGPMGYFNVAVVVRDDERADEIIPLHMAESIKLKERAP